MSRAALTTVWLVLVLTALAPPTLGAAQPPTCITDEARAHVTSCAELGAAPRAPTAAGLPSHLPAAVAQEAPPVTPTGPSISLTDVADPQRAHSAIRERELLEHEILVIERIGGRTREIRPELAVRDAETYLELSAWWDREAARIESSDAPDAAAADAARAQARTHLESAVRTYARIVEHAPGYPALDDVLNALMIALETLGHEEIAAAVAQRLLRDFPASRHVPSAWLTSAERAFDAGETARARELYEHVLETPAERNPVYGYALYKLAWTLYGLEDFRGALGRFTDVLAYAAAHSDAHDAESLARQARRELVLPYARVGRPAQALAFFRRFAASEDDALGMLEDLGTLYADTGHWPEAIQVFHALMSEAPASDRTCLWQSRVTSAVVSSRPKDEQLLEARRLVDVMRTFGAAPHPDAAHRECRQATATMLVELATAWHREALGDGTQPGTLDPTTMERASALYDLLVDELPDLGELEYPEIDRRDWPTPYRVAYFRAELLWGRGDFRACGPAFDRVIEIDPAGEYSADAAYAEVLCYERVYRVDYEPHERERASVAASSAPHSSGTRRGHAAPSAPTPAPGPPPARALTSFEAAMARAFQRYLCVVADAEERATVHYRLGRVYYDASHFEEASVAFRAVATEHPGSELGEIAANLHLDALNAIYRRETRASCVTELRSDLEPLASLYCATEEASAAHPDLCPQLEGLRCDVLRMDAESLARDADHAHAASGYLTIAREHPTCGRRDEMLWNAAIEYEAARLLGRAIQVRIALVQSFPESPLAPRATYLVGANYHALAIYASAAEWYERFARGSPTADERACSDQEREAGTCAIARVALENAALFREGLGQDDEATADVTLYASTYRREHPEDVASVAFSLVSMAEHRGDWTSVAREARSWLRDHGAHARLDERMRAQVLLGHAEIELGRAEHAGSFFRTALREWQSSGEAAIAALPGTDEERALRSARAREAASEARYRLAEEDLAAFRAIHMPPYRGQRVLSSVLRWSSAELGPWLERRFAALRTAEAAYAEVAPFGVPAWEIAAAARVGEMYRSIVDDVRAAPIPDDIANDDELYGIYVGTLERVLNGSTAGPDGVWDTADDVACTDASTEPSCVGSPLRQATEHFAYCLTLATRVRWFDEHSHTCERALHEMDAAAYPIAAELRGTPSFDRAELATPAPVRLDRERDEGAAPEDAPSS